MPQKGFLHPWLDKERQSTTAWARPDLGLQTPTDCMSAATLSFDDFFYSTELGTDAPSTSRPVKTEPPNSDLPDSAFDFFPSSSCALAVSPAVPTGLSPDHPLKTETGFPDDAFKRGFPDDPFPSFHTNTDLPPLHDQQQNTAAQANGDVDASLEVYRELILRTLVTDISSTCAKLRISTDPEEWSGRDAVVWAEEMAAQFQLGELNTGALALPGRRLVTLSRDDFLNACPRTGDTLHAQLQIWKTAADFRRLNNPPPIVSGPHRPDFASEWLASWDPNAEDTSPALQHQLPPLAASHYGLCVNTQPQSYAPRPNMGPHYAHLLSPSDSDSGISADLEEDLGGGVRKLAMPGQSTGSIHLWQFIRELLDHPDKYAQCVRWIDRAEGIFKIEDSHKLARLWGQRKNRHKMNYDKLSRSLRQYYKKGIIRKTGQRQRLIYQFIPPYHLL